MISHTESFARLRNESQKFLNFTVLVCQAVPVLRKRVDESSPKFPVALEPPDYFQPGHNHLEQLAQSARSYQAELSRVAVMTLFSLFEGYVRSVLGEILEFHGGEKIFLERAEKRARQFIEKIDPSLLPSKRKLQEPAKPSKVEKYRKNTEILKTTGYRFPSEYSHFRVHTRL